MFGPHLFKFRQLLRPSTTYHVMLKVKLFSVIPQKAIPQKASTKGILFLLIPNALLQKKEKISLRNTAPVNSLKRPLSLLLCCSSFSFGGLLLKESIILWRRAGIQDFSF